MSEQKLTPEQRQKMLRRLKYGPKLKRKALSEFAARLYQKVLRERG